MSSVAIPPGRPGVIVVVAEATAPAATNVGIAILDLDYGRIRHRNSGGYEVESNRERQGITVGLAEACIAQRSMETMPKDCQRCRLIRFPSDRQDVIQDIEHRPHIAECEAVGH